MVKCSACSAVCVAHVQKEAYFFLMWKMADSSIWVNRKIQMLYISCVCTVNWKLGLIVVPEVPGMSYSGFKLYASLLFSAKAAWLNIRGFWASAEELQIKRKALNHWLVRITSLPGAQKETCCGSADVDGTNVLWGFRVFRECAGLPLPFALGD